MSVEPSATTPGPALTVVVPTTRGAAAIAECLDSLLPQARAAGGEILVIDGSHARAPAAAAAPGPVRWVSAPGEGIFELRRRGLLLARTPLVALTEDHCRLAPDWWSSVMRAHETWPEALAVKGQVTNGSQGTLLDRAAFLLNQLAAVVPLDRGPFASQVNINTVSFRRQEVWTIDGFGVPCVEARRLAVDDRVRVEHVQSCGWLEMAALQYDNARAISGIRGLQSPRDWLRLLGAPWLAWARTLRVASVCRAKRLGGAVVACLPIVLVLFYAKAAGEVAGYLAGPGDSARRLH